MQDVPFDGAVSMIRAGIDKVVDNCMKYDHIYLRIEDGEVMVKLCAWPERDATTQTEDDRLTAVRRFEREMYDDTNVSVWLEIFPCSIEVGYRDVNHREVTISKEFERAPRVKTEQDDDERPESIAECA